MSLTKHDQSLYRKYFTSYSNKPTKLWIKIQDLEKKKVPVFLLGSAHQEVLAAESQLAAQGHTTRSTRHQSLRHHERVWHG